jgi:hypothetical protein
MAQTISSPQPFWYAVGSGQYLGATGRAVEDAIGQAAHLGVTALTRVFAKSPGKGNYLLERPHDGFVESTPAAVALGQAREKAPRLQPTASAIGADYLLYPGRSRRPYAWTSHISVAPPVASASRETAQ